MHLQAKRDVTVRNGMAWRAPVCRRCRPSIPRTATNTQKRDFMELLEPSGVWTNALLDRCAKIHSWSVMLKLYENAAGEVSAPESGLPGVFHRDPRLIPVQLTAPLSVEDCTVQSMPDASPWRNGIWRTPPGFFETFILERFEPGFKPFDPAFRVLFNSYYKRHRRAIYARAARAVDPAGFKRGFGVSAECGCAGAAIAGERRPGIE